MSLDKENTIRILKGEPQLQKLRCRIGFHRWVQWQPTDILGQAFDTYCGDCKRPHDRRWELKAYYKGIAPVTMPRRRKIK